MAKARVHELAKEFGVTSKEVLAALTDMGEYVKSPSSTVEPPVVRRLTEERGDAWKAAAEVEGSQEGRQEGAGQEGRQVRRACRSRRRSAGRSTGRSARRSNPGPQAQRPPGRVGTGARGRGPGCCRRSGRRSRAAASLPPPRLPQRSLTQSSPRPSSLPGSRSRRVSLDPATTRSARPRACSSRAVPAPVRCRPVRPLRATDAPAVCPAHLAPTRR